MRMKEGFVLRTVAGQTVVLPSGDELNLNLMITLNETGAFLWEQLVEGTNKEELLRTMLETYEVTQEEAERDIDEFLDVLYKNNIL